MVLVFSASAVSAVDYKVEKNSKGDTKVTTKDGKVYINPKVMSHSPDGLEIGHKNGITFVPFTKLPEDVQKKYSYDPKEAEEYSKRKVDAVELAKAERQRKAQEEEKQHKKMLERKKIYNQQHKEKEIGELKNRIAELNKLIPELESKIDRQLKNMNTVSARSTAYKGSRNYSWRGGVVYTSRGRSQERKAEKEKNKTLDNLNEEYLATKKKLADSRKELKKDQEKLAKMESAK